MLVGFATENIIHKHTADVILAHAAFNNQGETKAETVVTTIFFSAKFSSRKEGNLLETEFSHTRESPSHSLCVTFLISLSCCF